MFGCVSFNRTLKIIINLEHIFKEPFPKLPQAKLDGPLAKSPAITYLVLTQIKVKWKKQVRKHLNFKYDF